MHIKKIGIYGGTFDPITKSHILAATSILKYVDETWIMPCYQSLTKPNISNSEHRMNMIELAIKNNCRIKLWDTEIKNKNKYSYDTIKCLQLLYPNHMFYFVIGMDNANLLSDKFKNIVPHIVVSRKTYKASSSWFMHEPHKYLEINDEVSSSSQVKKSIRLFGYSNLVQPDVLDYILANRLYIYTKIKQV